MVFLPRRQVDFGFSETHSAGSGHGDSGGPVFTYRGLRALVGIIVRGNSSETRAVAIAPYYLWIKDTIEKLGAH